MREAFRYSIIFGGFWEEEPRGQELWGKEQRAEQWPPQFVSPAPAGSTSRRSSCHSAPAPIRYAPHGISALTASPHDTIPVSGGGGATGPTAAWPWPARTIVSVAATTMITIHDAPTA